MTGSGSAGSFGLESSPVSGHLDGLYPRFLLALPPHTKDENILGLYGYDGEFAHSHSRNPAPYHNRLSSHRAFGTLYSQRQYRRLHMGLDRRGFALAFSPTLVGNSVALPASEDTTATR